MRIIARPKLIAFSKRFPDVKFDYAKGIGFVRFLGTHKEYDQINAEEV